MVLIKLIAAGPVPETEKALYPVNPNCKNSESVIVKLYGDVKLLVNIIKFEGKPPDIVTPFTLSLLNLALPKPLISNVPVVFVLVIPDTVILLAIKVFIFVEP